MGNLAGWPYWKVVAITGQAGSGTDYQVELEIGDSAGGDFHLEGHCTNFPQDIRITDDDGTTLLDHWVEDLTADPIVVHVEVKDDLGSNQDVRVYYGKNGETTASNGDNTFEFFDDFSSLNWATKWQSTEQGKYSVSAGVLRLDKPTANTGLIETQNTYTDFICDIRSRRIGDTSSYFLFGDALPTADEYVDSTYESGANRFRTFVGGNVVHSSNGDSVSGTWYRSRMTIPSSGNATITVYSDNMQTTIVNNNDSPTKRTGNIGFLHWGTEYSELDFIYVRKYNSPEPAFSSAGAEQSPTGAAPTGVFYGPLVGPFGGPI